MIITFIGLLILCIFKFDIHFKRDWDGIFLVYRDIKRDLISGEYYEIYYSKKIINLNN